MFAIGLTGGIGTGKSEVSRILQGLGATVINADRVGHEAYKPDFPAWREVVAAFGDGIVQPTGEIDRKRLGAIVFADKEAMAKLNSIMHPRIAEIIQTKMDELRQEGTQAVVVEAALLVEAGWEYLVDEVWVTSSPEDMVLERLRLRNGLSDDAIKRRISAQLPPEQRLCHAQAVVRNSGNIGELQQEVESLWSDRVKGKVE